MKFAIIIPARFGSTRYPGKPLVKIKLPDGSNKTLIELTWNSAKRVKGVTDIFITTDDKRIKNEAEGFGANVIMTSASCENGTARCAQAVLNNNLSHDYYINLQGDAPLTPPRFITQLINQMLRNPSTSMCTPVIPFDKESFSNLLKDKQKNRVGATTVVFNSNRDALYFSKEIIPYANSKNKDPSVEIYHHVGVYCYKKSALMKYLKWPEGLLERAEGLEQLRFLENDEKVKCVIVEKKQQAFWELNNPEDKIIIEMILEKIDGK